MEQTHNTEGEEWKWEQKNLEIKTEEQISLLCEEPQNKAEYEKQAMQRQFELHEAEITWLQGQQAVRIIELEKSLKEQQNSIQHLEDSLVNAETTLAQYDSELTSTKAHMAEELEKAKHTLQEEYKAKLQDAQSRKKLQESYQQALKLLLKTANTTKNTMDLICEKTGLCLDDSLASGDSGERQIMIGETVLTEKHKTERKWSLNKSNEVGQGKICDQTLPEYSFDSSVPYEIPELSEHLCESIFENPDFIFENEERIHKIGHGLQIAVEKLLELVESTKQLEETHTSGFHCEEEFKRRNWTACQGINEHHELMDCLNEESKVKNQLELELHKSRGLIEGYLAERHALEQALHLKEESECHLVVELESLKAQVQELTQEHARSVEEQKLIINQNKALAANIGEREVDLINEIEHLTKAKLELKCQAEKEYSTLNAQMKILEMELEEQLTKNQSVAMVLLEVTDLRQQVQALERQLKSQRIFMDKQAAEWEDERDEFQKEIQKLEMKLKMTTKSQVSGQSRVYLAKEVLQQQQYNNLIQISTLQSKLDEVLTEGSLDHTITEKIKAEEELTTKKKEILEKQVLETEDKKSLIEHLNGNREQLARDKSKEIDQFHRVIGKQQKELALVAPVCHKMGDSQGNLNNFALVEQVENLQNKLKNGSQNYLVNRNEDDNYLLLNSSQKQLLADRETLQKLPEGKQSPFKTEVKILEQNLHNIQETSRQQFNELTTLQLQYKELQEEHKLLKLRFAQRDTKMAMSTSCIQELEDNLRERKTKVLERGLQLQIHSEQKVEQTVEVQQIKENVQLENKPHVLTQRLHDKEVTYPREVRERKAAVAEFITSQTEEKVEELEALRSERHLFHSHLKSNMEKDQNNDQKETKLHKLVPSLDASVSSEETEEEGEKRESNNKLSVSAGFSYRDKLEKNITVTNLKTSKNLNIQDKNVKDILLVQEAEITNAIKKHQNLQPLFQQMWQLNHLSQSPQLTQKIMDNFKCIVMDKTSWDSPEIMRKQNNSMELQASLPVTPFSEVDAMHSISFENLYPENSVIQGDNLGLLKYPISYFNGNEKTASSLFQSFEFPGSTFSAPDYNGVPESISVRDAEGFTLMPPELQDDLKSTMPGLESANTEYGSNTSSDLILQLKWKDPETTIHQDGNVMAYLQCFGMVPDVTEPAVKQREFLSEQLKNVLKMVYEESYKVLALSEKSLPLDGETIVQQAPSVEGWRRERLTLLDTVQSLKDYLNNVSDKEDKENSSSVFDWRGELLQAVECVLEKERNMLQSYLQSHFHNSGSGDKGSLVEKLEHIVEQQEQQQKIVLEHLLSSDRNSLLTEIQDLEAQLRLMHLQSQEKLQQLQETLINTENHGSKQEHQLRRQVELLEYNLQQEKLIASDLQASVQREQEKASEMNELLKEEHTAILNLKSELCESKQTNERLEKLLQELQREVIKYRSAMENKDAFQDLQNKQRKEKELQNMLDEQHHQHKIREDEKSKAIEELQAALELQCIQNNQLSVALEHEQSANSNLRKELQIEHSRCEALLFQDQNKLLELQKNIDVEKNRSLELSSALNHERVLTEQLSIRINECRSCKHQDLLQELQAQLYIERSYARELLAVIEKTQQQALNSKKQMDEMQRYCEEPQEKQNYTSLQVTQATLQNLKQDIIHTLKIQGEKETQLKKEWEQLQPIPRALRAQESRTEQGIRERRQRGQQADCDKLKELQEAQGSQVIPTYIINSMEESGVIAYQDEKSVLQNSLKATENDATKTNFVLENKSTMASSNLKMQKLYRKYLRAESFRKALVYQKKYLLLLLGGFQECEQATLSLIARMGIYPSPADLNVSKSQSRSFTKFRSAVRAVIAISRLKFLMKKWHKVGRKEMPAEAISPTVANKSYLRGRTEVLKQQQPFPGYATQEAGYCNRSNNMRLVNYSPKSPHHLHNRFSSASSKDPEHSLTEYIAHLEAIQQRLGILMPGQPQL